MWMVEPRFVVPHRTTFSRNIVPKIYKEEKLKQSDYLNSIVDYLESVTITTDIWSSRAHDSFISCTLQFIVNIEEQDIFKLEHLTIDCKPFPGSHTGERICEFAFDMVKEIGIDTNFVEVYIVSDNAANMVAALEQPTYEKTLDDNVPDMLRESKPWNHLRCVDHTLQLAISDTRKSTGTNTVVEKVIPIVSRYSYSNIARENLKKHQEDTKTVQHEIVKNVVTRWNSEFLMLERFVEQKIPITLELAAEGEDCLSAQQWKMAEGYVQVLRPIAQFTADLGSTQHPTLSMVLPVLEEIKTSLQDFIKKSSNKGAGIIFARTLLKNINSRFPDIQYKENPTFQLATLLDPRFKDLLMDTHIAANMLENAALEKLRKDIRRGRVQENVDSFQEQAPADKESYTGPPHPKKPKWGNLKKKSSLKNNSDKRMDEIDRIRSEVKNYLSSPNIDVDTGNALLFWKINRKVFPSLVGLAAHYLGIAATEVQSERDFSAGGNTVTPKRTDLSTEHVRQNVFLHANLEVPPMHNNQYNKAFQIQSSE